MTPAEDELRAAMLARQHEAPGERELTEVLDGLHIAHRRRSAWRPLLTVAAVLVVAIGVVAIGDRHSSTSPTAVPERTPVLSCPSSYDGGRATTQPWVPALPTVADGSARLVPEQAPGQVVVCAFLHDSSRPTGSRQLAATELPAVTAALTWTPRTTPFACTAVLEGTDGDNYLIGLSYPDGTVWVGVDGNHCSGSTNGVFSSALNLRLLAASLYAGGALPAAAQPCNPSTGRLGQETALVPGHPTSVTACAGPAVPGQPVTITAGLNDLVRALNALPTAAFTGTSQPPSGPTTIYSLTFGYSAGPPVSVQVWVGSKPPIENGSLQADDPAGTVAALVERLINRR